MPPFILQIFQSELDKIQRYVLDFPNIETGGDLFGLWSRNGEPVVQLIIGPGAKCRRTSVSFHQDIDYLQNVGTFLNTSFMLCHIGSWHSHHQLSLTQPSSGDRSTVCNNFPRGLQRYIMIIANIGTSNRNAAKSVQIHPYMFTSEGHVLARGTVQRISSTSPYMEYGYVLNRLKEGAERSRGFSKSEYDSPREVKSPVRADRRSARAKAPSTSENIRPTTVGQRNGYQEMSAVHQWYSSSEGKAKLQKIDEDIRVKLKPTKDVEFSRNPNSFDLSLEFVHNNHKWLIEFPKLFDKVDAKIQRDSAALISSKNIIEAIQKDCVCHRCCTTRLQDDRVAFVNRDAGKSKDSFRAGSKSARQEWGRYKSPAEKPSAAGGPWQRTTSKSVLKTSRNPGRDIPSTSRHATPNSRSGKRAISAKVTARIDSGYVAGTLGAKTASKNRQQWYSGEDGERTLHRIVTDISARLLDGKDVHMSRSTHSNDLLLEFNHKRPWRVLFPPDYPDSVPDIGYYDSKARYYPVKMSRRKDIVSAIRANCFCLSCKRYGSARLR